MEPEPVMKTGAATDFPDGSDLEKRISDVVTSCSTEPVSVKAPPMTFNRLMVLFALTLLFIVGGIPVLFLGAGLCTRLGFPP